MNIETILIVDGDPTVRKMVAKIIVSHGHTCQMATDGLDALDLIEKNRFDIVICDINIPKLDGLGLMAKVHKIKPETVFVAITDSGSDYSYDRVIRAGAQDLIKKPLTVEEFNNRLMRIIAMRRLEEENKQLQREQADLNERLSTLMAVASDLTSELEFDRLFPLIVGKVTEAMSAERTSLYVIDWENKKLWTKVAEGIDQIRLPMGKGISGRVAESGETLNVADAWELPYYNREFDQKNQFRTKSVLCMPIKNHVGERIGIIQVINKKGKEYFDSDDETFLKSLMSQVGIALDNSLLHEELRLSFDSSIITLSATVDARHPLTAGHSQRVTEYSLLIAGEMGLSKEEIEVLKFAALLHDIGKIGIRDEVLLKNGPFTPEERAEMNTHPIKTKSILDNFRFSRALREVPEIAAHHHEKINGQGYPNGLTGDQLPLGSKIMAVADVFDALTSHRDYPKHVSGETLNCDSMPLPKAISILENEAGSHFDPDVVAAFLRCLPRALLLYRGNHFPPEYVDDMIRSLAPDLLP